MSWCVTHKKYVLLALVQSIPAWYLIGSKKTNGVLRLGRKLLKLTMEAPGRYQWHCSGVTFIKIEQIS